MRNRSVCFPVHALRLWRQAVVHGTTASQPGPAASATGLKPDHVVSRADCRMRVGDSDGKRRSRHHTERLRADRIPSLGTETISALRPGGSETLPKEPDTLCSAVIAPAAMAV